MKHKYKFDPSTLAYVKVHDTRFITRLWRFLFGPFYIMGLAISLGVLIYNPLTKSGILGSQNNSVSLSDLNKELDSINKYIANQKFTIEKQDQILNNLKAENFELQLVLNANKEKIQALFQVQEQLARERVWIDRIIGFLGGLLSSYLIAMLFRRLDINTAK